jgi:MFS family permease
MADPERRTMRRNIRELPRPAWILVGGNCINWFASFAVIFLALYLTKRGFSIPQAGGAVAAFGGGGIAAGVVAGHLADRFGRRTTMALSMFASAVTILLLYFVRPYVALVALAFAAGLATDTWRPASRALMADVVPEGQRVTAYALVRFAGHAGYAGGAAVAGFLADRSFLWVFAMDAATSVVFGVIALVALPEGRRTAKAEDMQRGGYATLAADRAFLLLFAASVLVAFVFAQQQTTLPLYVQRVVHLRPSDFGVLISLNGLLILAAELPISSITMRRPPRQILALGFLLFGAGFALTATAHSLPALLGTVAIWTLGEMISAPVAYAYLADLAPEHLRGRYQGVYELAWGFGGVAGPAVGAVLFAWSANGVWALCGGLGLAASLFVLAGPRRAPIPAEPQILLPEAEPAAITPPL